MPDTGKLAPGILKSNFWASDPNGIKPQGCGGSGNAPSRRSFAGALVEAPNGKHRLVAISSILDRIEGRPKLQINRNDHPEDR
jgi:hypothetical protein